MSSINVNDGGTFKPVLEVHVNDGGTWKRANEVFVNDGGTWKTAFGVTYINLSRYTPGIEEGNFHEIVNFNLANFLNITNPTIVSITVEAGTRFVSRNNTVPAFDVGSLPAGSTVLLSIPSDAIITGRGGNGGYGSNSEGGQGIAGDFLSLIHI